MSENERSKSNRISTLLRVVWFSTLLALAIEILLFIVAFGSGSFQNLQPFIADLVQKISWSILVCVGLALGVVIPKARLQWMGILGFFSAPIAFYFSRALHKEMIQLLDTSALMVMGYSLLIIAFIKAVEYGLLGVLLGRIEKKSPARIAAYLFVGFTLGVFFASIFIFVVNPAPSVFIARGVDTLITRAAIAPLSTSDFLSKAINEIVFPMGCSLVLFGASAVVRKSQ